MSELVKNGVVRLYLEVRYDVDFSLNEPASVEEVIKKIMDSTDLYDMASLATGEYVEVIHGIMVDVNGEQGEYEHTAALYETPEEIEGILDKIGHFGTK